MKAKLIIAIGILALLYSSCEKTLEEDFYSGGGIDLFISSESGFENMVTACYVSTKMWYGKEYGWDLTTVGTDLWTFAGDADDMRNLAMYTSNFNNSWPGRLGVVWSELYKAINACNTTLQYIPDADISEEKKIMREGEVRFLRALYNWHLVETWGDVALMTEPITEPILTMERTDVDVFYTQIFEDLDFAVENLPEAAEEYGRVYKYAALAFRARAHLYWAAEYMSGNAYNGQTYGAIGGVNHYQQAIDDAQEVIDNGGFELYDDYTTLWEMENNASASSNSENIWAINYSQSIYAALNVDPVEYDNILEGTDPKPYDEREGGNHGHLMFGMRWFGVGGTSTVMVKDDGQNLTSTEPTRPFCRYMPTKFLIDLYDANLDQRFYGSFNNVFYANNPDETAYPRWLPFEILGDNSMVELPAEQVGQPILGITDTAFVMYKDQVIPETDYYLRGTSSNRWYLHRTGNYYFFDMTHMYAEDGSVNSNGTNERRAYFDLQKWYDRTRPHNGENQDVVGSQRGQRDFIVFRLPEMHYIIAEASLGMGDPQTAYDQLKIIADKRAVDGNGTALLQAYGVSGAGDVDIDAILDDKAREMAGEQQRWFDLKRTGKTLERIAAHNPDAAPNIQEKHIVRPIPQTELDAIENKEDFLSGWGIY